MAYVIGGETVYLLQIVPVEVDTFSQLVVAHVFPPIRW